MWTLDLIRRCRGSGVHSLIEFAGGIALILGLFTRFFAAAAAIELLIITWVYWKTVFSCLIAATNTRYCGVAFSRSRCAAAGRTRSTGWLGKEL